MRKSKRNIVIGQRVNPDKVKRARTLRQQMTKQEEVLWEYLRANRLEKFHFRRQQIIDGFIVDFYCHMAGLVIEVDGAAHGDQIAYDMERDRILQARGLRILRIGNEEVCGDLEGVLQRIKSHLRKHSH